MEEVRNAIEVSRLTKRFGDILAVDGISFQVKEGELFGFLGPNGAGKTTTMRMLAGVLKPDEGRIRIMGFDISKAPLEAKMLMGIVPEMANPYIDLSVWDNLMLMGELYGMPKRRRRRRAEELLELFGLGERKDRKARELSKGMRQRLILAMALIHEPKLLLLDEPTSGLDVQSARLIRGIIRELNRGGVTVFLTTHNIAEADQMCDRIAIINRGKIIAIDEPKNLKAAIKSTQSVEIAFDKPVDESELRQIEGVGEIRRMGDRFRLYTDEPGDVAARLVEYAETHGLKVLSLNTLGPSLEDVFVYLTRAGEGDAGE